MKQLLCISLLLLFLATIFLPSIVLVIDDRIDVSLILDLSEEEEEKSNEMNKELELLLFLENNHKLISTYLYTQNSINYLFKTYTSPYLNIIFPPPEYT